MKNIYIISIFFATVFQMGAQILSTTRFIGDGQVSIEINKSTNKTKITAEFPKAGYFALGFGSQMMSNTYTVLMNSNNGDLEERKLPASTIGSGTKLVSTFSLVNKVENGNNFIFTIEKTNIPMSDYFDFNTVMAGTTNQLNAIAAFRDDKIVAQHTSRFQLKYTFTETPLSLNPTIEASKIYLSPNPTSEKLKVTLPNPVADVNVIIYDLNALQIKEQYFKNAQEMEITVSDLPTGNYIIQINGENLGHSYKFAKQ